MTTTTNFGFNIPDGTDNVNLLTQNYPNWTNLDAILKAIKDTGITTATATKTGTNFAVVRNDMDCKNFEFVATANYAAGDTFTVDGVPVTATAVDGTALVNGAFVINQTVVTVLNGTVMTVLVGGGISSMDANDVVYDNTGSGLTAANVQDAIDEIVGDIPTGFAASVITYDNTVSGLTAADVQAAIDELKALIPVTPTYITTGINLINTGASIVSGGYYIDNGYVYVDITLSLSTNVSNGSVIFNGLPQADGPAGSANITPTFNGGAIFLSGDRVNTGLVAKTSFTAPTSLHFIGSYLMA